MKGLLERLKAISQLPDSDKSSWLENATDSVSFLKDNYDRESEIILYANASHAFVQTVLAPTQNITPPDKEDLLGMDILPSSSWCIQRSYGGGEEHRVYLEPPLAYCGCNSLTDGEKLVFIRPFEGVESEKTQIEISQKLVHSLSLHFVEERQAYCRLDNKGDIQTVIKVYHDEGNDSWSDTRLVSILAKDLATYMALTSTSLVVKFDFNRFIPSGFDDWSGAPQEYYDANDLFYRFRTIPNHASYACGCFILRTQITEADLIKEWKAEEDSTCKQYETFKAYDRKNGQCVEVSCSPDHTANYFIESDLPWEISPVFFRAEVLVRYKNDPEKYRLTDRSISCRNSWYLDTYDINEEGQVHTYLRYLAKLPYEEQLYWKSFNEWPKTGISKRAYETDILGEFSSEDEPLENLRVMVSRLDESQPPWWKYRGQEMIDALHYPATDSPSEWGDELLSLDQLLVEGFLVTSLRTIADENDAKYEKDWGSLMLLEIVLTARGKENDHAKKIVAPLKELHNLRISMKAHGDLEGRSTATKKARRDFETLRHQYKDLISRLHESMKLIIGTLLEE
ncbi:MAG: hypothetical protein OXC38_01050 [Gammaproteobacteria bacterium]|nr:hypothetical protein [Gammaproteobacteria bacterium]